MVTQPYICSCQSQHVKSHNPSMSHFQLRQAQAGSCDWFPILECQVPLPIQAASMHCWQFFILPLVLEDKGSCQGALVIHNDTLCQTTVSDTEHTETGSSKYKYCRVWKIYSVRKAQNLYKENKLPCRALICRFLSTLGLALLEK